MNRFFFFLIFILPNYEMILGFRSSPRKRPEENNIVALSKEFKAFSWFVLLNQ